MDPLSPPKMIKIKIKNTFQVVTTLALLAGIMWFLYLGAKFLWALLSSINESLAVGIIAAASTVFVSVVTVLISKHLEQKALIRNEHRDKKIPIYEELITFLFKIWRAAKDNKNKPTEKEINDFMFSFTQKLIIWGSDEVVVEFNKFRQSGMNPVLLMLNIENIWFAIRRDLGHKNKGISRLMLLGLIINDVEEFIEKPNRISGSFSLPLSTPPFYYPQILKENDYFWFGSIFSKCCNDNIFHFSTN